MDNYNDPTMGGAVDLTKGLKIESAYSKIEFNADNTKSYKSLFTSADTIYVDASADAAYVGYANSPTSTFYGNVQAVVTNGVITTPANTLFIVTQANVNTDLGLLGAGGTSAGSTYYVQYMFYTGATTTNTGSDIYFYIPNVNSFTTSYNTNGDMIFTFSAFVNGAAKSIDILKTTAVNAAYGFGGASFGSNYVVGSSTNVPYVNTTTPATTSQAFTPSGINPGGLNDPNYSATSGTATGAPSIPAASFVMRPGNGTSVTTNGQWNGLTNGGFKVSGTGALGAIGGTTNGSACGTGVMSKTLYKITKYDTDGKTIKELNGGPTMNTWNGGLGEFATVYNGTSLVPTAAYNLNPQVSYQLMYIGGALGYQYTPVSNRVLYIDKSVISIGQTSGTSNSATTASTVTGTYLLTSATVYIDLTSGSPQPFLDHDAVLKGYYVYVNADPTTNNALQVYICNKLKTGDI
jgi:hypothetical protein